MATDTFTRTINYRVSAPSLDTLRRDYTRVDVLKRDVLTAHASVIVATSTTKVGREALAETFGVSASAVSQYRKAAAFILAGIPQSMNDGKGNALTWTDAYRVAKDAKSANVLDSAGVPRAASALRAEWQDATVRAARKKSEGKKSEGKKSETPETPETPDVPDMPGDDALVHLAPARQAGTLATALVGLWSRLDEDERTDVLRILAPIFDVTDEQDEQDEQDEALAL